jgi:hypothetical protein
MWCKNRPKCFYCSILKKPARALSYVHMRRRGRRSGITVHISGILTMLRLLIIPLAEREGFEPSVRLYNRTSV